MPECIAHRKLSFHENSVLDMSMSVCACVGVDVLYHAIKCTSDYGSQSTRLEKCCLGQTESTVSLLCSVSSVPSPNFPSCVVSTFPPP